MKLYIYILLLFFSISVKSQLPEFSIPISKDSVLTNKNISHNNVVFLFLSNSCPYSKIYEERITSIINRFENVLFVNLGDYPLKSLKNLVQYHDNKQYVQYAFKAKKNPSVYYYNKNTLIYWGAIDDNAQLAEDVRHDYLKEAIEKTLSGQLYEFNETRPVGCNY